MQSIRLFLDSLNFLDWWLLASILALADVFALRGWLLAAAIAAGITGFVLILFPQLRWPWQLIMFAVIAAVGLGWQWHRHRYQFSQWT